MKKLLLIFIVFIVSPIYSQISITENDFASQLTVGESFTSYQDTLTHSLNIGGKGQTSWDFSSLDVSFTAQSNNIEPSAAPKGTVFSNATNIVHSKSTIENTVIETWVYAQLTGNNYNGLGFYMESIQNGIQINTLTVYDPAEKVYQLPLTFGENWNDVGTREIESGIAGFPQSSTEDYSITKRVDAWGPLTMPNGSTEDALRVKIESDFTSNEMGTPVTTHNVYYEFITKSGSYVEIHAMDNSQPDVGIINVEDISWHYSPGSTSDVEQIDDLANNFSLAQNYPNPFNPTTKIQYSISKTSNVTLKVYDILGNEIETLVNKKLNPGVYNSTFDGSNFASGIYFYTLQAGTFTETKKLMLVK